jgi:hypothetical protein
MKKNLLLKGERMAKSNTDTKTMKKLKKVVENLENNYSVIMAIKENTLDEIPDNAVAIPTNPDDILLLLCLIIDHLKNTNKLHIVVSALLITEIFKYKEEVLNETIH